MSEFLKVPSVAIVVLVSAILLREAGFKGHRLFSALGIMGILLLALSSFEDIKAELEIISDDYGIGEALRYALKALGIGYLFSLSADMCRDLGEGGIASAVELAGRLELVLLSFPVLKEILQTATELLKNG